MENNTVGQIIIFLGTVLSTFVTLYIQNRNRKWDIEDRARIANEAREAAAALALKTEQAAADLAAKNADTAAFLARQTAQQTVVLARKTDAVAATLADTHAHLSEKIAENTQLSADAFREANNFNQRLAKIGTAFDAVRPLRPDQQDAIQSTVEDTNRLVRDLDETKKAPE